MSFSIGDRDGREYYGLSELYEGAACRLLGHPSRFYTKRPTGKGLFYVLYHVLP